MFNFENTLYNMSRYKIEEFQTRNTLWDIPEIENYAYSDGYISVSNTVLYQPIKVLLFSSGWVNLYTGIFRKYKYQHVLGVSKECIYYITATSIYAYSIWNGKVQKKWKVPVGYFPKVAYGNIFDFGDTLILNVSGHISIISNGIHRTRSGTLLAYQGKDIILVSTAYELYWYTLEDLLKEGNASFYTMPSIIRSWYPVINNPSLCIQSSYNSIQLCDIWMNKKDIINREESGKYYIKDDKFVRFSEKEGHQ